MKLSYLGHAMWLVEIDELRILCDPLLFETHHGGVFEVVPRRRIHAERLRPDFIIVSHRHPDHFDVPSLNRLAELDRDAVVLTSDDLVVRAAERCGFRTVRRLDAFAKVSLQGAQLMTTPSYGTTVEWGVMLATDAGVVWNQIDTIHRGIADVEKTIATARDTFGRDEAWQLELGLVQWQPLLEIEALMAGAIGFPFDAYGETLDKIAATGARALVPASAGLRHTAPYEAMNALGYPVTEARIARDLPARCPDAQVLEARVGGCYRLAGGEIALDPTGAADLIVLSETQPAPAIFDPGAIPALADPNLDGRPEKAMRRIAEAWITETLVPALAAADLGIGPDESLSLVLEAVFPQATDVYAIRARAGHAELRREHDPDYDLKNAIAGSQLVDVIEGRRHWGEPLLGGLIRACERAYAVDAEQGLYEREVAPIFLYYGLDYAESQERATEWMLGKE